MREVSGWGRRLAKGGSGCHARKMKIWRLMGAVLGLVLACGVESGAQEAGNWRAESSNARGVTGDLVFSGERVTIDFSSFPAAQIRVLKPEEAKAVFDVEDDAGGRGNLYRVSIPGTKKFLHHNTLCGSEETQWMVTYATRKSLQVAFFSGAAMPVMTVDGVANATSLCGTFSYAR